MSKPQVPLGTEEAGPAQPLCSGISPEAVRKTPSVLLPCVNAGSVGAALAKSALWPTTRPLARPIVPSRMRVSVFACWPSDNPSNAAPASASSPVSLPTANAPTPPSARPIVTMGAPSGKMSARSSCATCTPAFTNKSSENQKSTPRPDHPHSYSQFAPSARSDSIPLRTRQQSTRSDR